MPRVLGNIQRNGWTVHFIGPDDKTRVGPLVALQELRGDQGNRTDVGGISDVGKIEDTRTMTLMASGGGMAQDWITVQIERPSEGYEDVCPELVAEDAMAQATSEGWSWRMVHRSENALLAELPPDLEHPPGTARNVKEPFFACPIGEQLWHEYRTVHSQAPERPPACPEDDPDVAIASKPYWDHVAACGNCNEL